MITVNASRREPICLRHQGENDAMRVAFPLSAFEADWPGGTPLLLVQRPRSSRDAEAYPVALSVDGHTAYWTVSASDIEYSGYGKAQLQWRVEDVLVKSCIYDTVCVPSLHAGAEPPYEPSKRWFDAIQAQIGDLSKLTTEEKENLVAAINEAARSGGSGGGVQADWSQNDTQATDFVKNRPGAYMTDPVETEIFDGILQEQAETTMQYVPKLGDAITISVNGETIQTSVKLDPDAQLYCFGNVTYAEFVGGTVENCVFFGYESGWAQLAKGSYVSQSAIVTTAQSKPVMLDAKYIPKELFQIDVSASVSGNTPSVYKVSATYEEIKAVREAGKTPLVVLNSDTYLKLVKNDRRNKTYTFFGYYSSTISYTLVIAESGEHTISKDTVIDTIPYSTKIPEKSTVNGYAGDSENVARADHRHPKTQSLIDFSKPVTAYTLKTVEIGTLEYDKTNPKTWRSSGLDIVVGSEITMTADDGSTATTQWLGNAQFNMIKPGDANPTHIVNLNYNCVNDSYIASIEVFYTNKVTGLVLKYDVNAYKQSTSYQQFILAPYMVAPHLLLASQNGLHKLTVDDNRNVLVDGVSVDGTVTEANIEKALGYKPIGADDVPVKSVNGQTGEAKTNWYFNVTGSVASPATTQTAAQIVAAQKAGFAPICSATFSDFQGLPATLPALLISDMACVFGGIGSTGGNTFYLTVMIDGAGTLTAKTDDVASKDDIPTIPTELKNPHSLNIKIGDTTTSYDGSAAKTVEIPEGGGTDASLGITGAAAGKIPKIKAVDAAGKPTEWEATALPNEAFIVYFTQEIQLAGDPILTSDRTPEEVITAIASKKLVIALLEQDNKVTQLCNIANNGGYLYFFTIGKAGDVVGIGWNIERDMESGTTYTLTTMAPWNFIGYNGVSGPYQIFGTGELGGYEFKQHIGFENLPGVTASDNGKFMRVVNGAWAAVEIANANGGSF